MLLRAFRKAGASAKAGATNNDGLAALEFALILPVMIALFFGTIEVSLALLARADVSVMASTAADLISQKSAVANTDFSNVYAAAGAILYPNPGTPSIRITSVVDDGSGAPNGTHLTGTVAWSCTQQGTGTLPPAPTGPVTLPKPMMTPGGSVIIAEVAYDYASPTSAMITGKIKMTNNFWTKPRRVLQITAPASCT
jgi:Flp pilus assembly protein TadG